MVTESELGRAFRQCHVRCPMGHDSTQQYSASNRYILRIAPYCESNDSTWTKNPKNFLQNSLWLRKMQHTKADNDSVESPAWKG